MRLFVLHSQLGILRGGGENFSRNMFTAFAGLGHQVRVAFAADPFGRYPYPLPEAVDAMPIRGWWFEQVGQATLSAVGRRLTPYPAIRGAWDHAQGALAWRTFYWSNRKFHHQVMKDIGQAVREADAVYVHSNAFLAADVAKIRPTVLRLPGPLTAEMEPILRSIHAVCANGDALARIRTFLNDRAVELPVGLDDRCFCPGASDARAQFGWTHEHRVIGYVGRLSHIKGVDLLAESFRIVARTNPAARLLIVGTGEEMNNLRATLSAEIASGSAKLLGDVAHERLPALYRAMDVLVMPSRYENYSNAILEGLACAVPFIGSDIGGNRGLSETGAGWLFEPGSSQALAESLAIVLGDAEERVKRGNRGRGYVDGRYSWTATARRLEKIIGEVSQRPLLPSPSSTAVGRRSMAR